MRRPAVLLLAVLSVAVIAASVVGMRTGGSTLPATERRAGPSSSPVPHVPAVVKHCWVETPAGTVSMTGDQAKHLTTFAATAGSSAPAERRVRRQVDRALALPEPQAAAVTGSLMGRRTTSRLACAYPRRSVGPQQPGLRGLTGRARHLRAEWTQVFGPLTAGGFGRGGVRSGHVDSSSHYDGRAIDVFFRPHDDPQQRRAGRLFAQWLVAHAHDYAILSVIYADRIWTSWASSSGWREYVHPSGDTDNPVLRHLDHVHVAVESGEPWGGR